MESINVSPILVERTYETILSAIATCELEPGERIRQNDLAGRLGVSRQPVSHALQMLKRDGLVEDAGRKGLQVAPIDASCLRDLYQVRAALDALSARLAAERVADGAASEIEKALLRDILLRGESLGDATPIGERIRLDIAFHAQVNAMSGNRKIADTLEPQIAYMMRSMKLVLDSGRFRASVWVDHRGIAELILSGQGEKAAEAARSHAETAGRDTAERLKAPRAAA